MLDFLESKTSPRSDTELNVHSNTGPRLPSARLVLEMASKGGTVNLEVLFSRRHGHLTSPVCDVINYIYFSSDFLMSCV